jgi:hypothetical protein
VSSTGKGLRQRVEEVEHTKETRTLMSFSSL